jgi:hypothetical protein
MAKLLDPSLYNEAGPGKIDYLDENDLQGMSTEDVIAASAPSMPSVERAPSRAPAASAFPSLSQIPQEESPMPEQDFNEALEMAREKEASNNLIKATNALLVGQAAYSGARPNLSAANAAIDASTEFAKGKAGNMLAKEKFAQELSQTKLGKAKAKQAADDIDPNSDASVSFRKMIEANFPDVVRAYGPMWNSVAAGDKDKIFDPLRLKEQINSREQLARIAAQERADARKDKEDDKASLLKYGMDVKEQAQIKKENRATRKDLDKAESSAEAALRDLKNVKKQFEAYSKGVTSGTGPVATLGGLTKYISQDTEKLDSAFKKVALGEMVKMFAGMSKAVDSNAERRAFEATQPSVALDDETNKQILDAQIKAAESLIKKTRAAKAQFDRTGDFVSEEPTQDAMVEQENAAPEIKEVSGVKYIKVPGGWKKAK